MGGGGAGAEDEDDVANLLQGDDYDGDGYEFIQIRAPIKRHNKVYIRFCKLFLVSHLACLRSMAQGSRLVHQ